MLKDKRFPLVSILFPVYNSEKYLQESIDCIVAQTYENYEVIAVDDGSTDNSYDLLQQLLLYTKSHVLVRNDINKGNSYSLNVAIENSSGEYLMRFDADDLMNPNKIEMQVEVLLNNPNIDVVGCSYDRISENGKFLFRRLVPIDNNKIVKLISIRKFFLSGPNFEITDGTIMARKEWFRKYKYDENIFFAQDFNLIARSLSKTKFANISDSLYSYRVGSGVTANFGAQIAACKVKWNSIKNIPRKYLSLSNRLISFVSLFFRPLFYLLIILFHKFFK